MFQKHEAKLKGVPVKTFKPSFSFETYFIANVKLNGILAFMAVLFLICKVLAQYMLWVQRN